jgi:hypothetical protein
MANRLPFQLPITLCLLVLSFVLCWRYGDAGRSPLTSAPRNSTQLYLHGSGFALADLNGDQELDLAEGLCLGHTKDGYFYQVQLRLSGNTSSSVFTIFHNNALGLKITGLDIDNDDDIDLIISDRFFGQQIGLWLNDGKGRFVKSPGVFSRNDVDAAFAAAVNANFAGQRTGVRDRRRYPDYLATTRSIQPLLLTSPRLKEHPLEWTAHFAVDLLQQRPPPSLRG